MKNKLMEFLEKKLIAILIVIILAITCILRVNLYSINKIDTLLTNTITVVSIFIGILMSMLGFLLTVSGKSVVKNMKRMGTHKILLNYFMLPIGSGIITVIISILITVLDGNKTILSIGMSILWVVCISYFTLAFIRVVFLMYYLLITVFEEEEDDVENINEQIGYISNLKDEDVNCDSDPYDNPDEYL